MQNTFCAPLSFTDRVVRTLPRSVTVLRMCHFSGDRWTLKLCSISHHSDNAAVHVSLCESPLLQRYRDRAIRPPSREAAPVSTAMTSASLPFPALRASSSKDLAALKKQTQRGASSQRARAVYGRGGTKTRLLICCVT